MAEIQIMLVDDHQLMRQGLISILQQEATLHIMSAVESGEECLRQVEAGLRPDVVLMDVQMRGISGVETTRQLRQRLPTVKIIALTAVEDEDTIFAMIQAGAWSYLLKSAAASELVAAIHAAQERQAISLPASLSEPSPALIKTAGTDEFSLIPRRSRTDRLGLAGRELEVMKGLLKGYSNKEIAQKLIISERTVQTHLGNIFTKLEVTSRTEAVLAAIRRGWITN